MTPVRREGYKFRQDLYVPCYQTDGQATLKLASFMDMAQEIAYWAAMELGFGYDDLHTSRKAWVLSRMHVHVIRLPRWRDPVSLFTWHKGADGPFYLRDFVLQDSAGDRLLSCTSSWVVMDEQSRRMVRPDELQTLLQAAPDVDHALVTPAPKLVLPRDAQPVRVGQHRVSYADIDMLGHTNNARYLVWAMDAMDAYEHVSGLQVKDVYLNFIRETLPGEEVVLECVHVSGPAGTEYDVRGLVDGTPHFFVKIVC